jgi:hypothetical protein
VAGLAETVEVPRADRGQGGGGFVSGRQLRLREWAPTLWPVAVAVLTVAAFSPVLRNDFVRWDDHVVLLGNPHYRGLGWTQIRWMFTTRLLGHYMPVTWLSYGLDHTLWGMNPAGYHLTSLLLHAANAVLVYLVARRLLARAAGLAGGALDLAAAAAALVFAIHPLRVESVAWATERRDVLSGLFGLLSILTYLRAVDGAAARRRPWLAASIGCFALALASKTIVMTLPLVLALLDVYPLRRLGPAGAGWLGPAARAVWWEKLPYAGLTLVWAAVAYYAHAGITLAQVPESPVARLGVVAYALWFYVVKTLVPVGLSPIYEARVEPAIVVSVLGVAGLTAGFVAARAWWPAGLTTWTAYLILLAPVSGVIDVGIFVADRYAYLATLPWALLLGAGAGLLARLRAQRRIGAVAAGLAVVAGLATFAGLGALTWRQVHVWQDTESLWRHAIRVAPECATCQTSLGNLLVGRGDRAAGVAHLERALSLAPDRVWLHINIGAVLFDLGRASEAIVHFEQLLERCEGVPGPCQRQAAAAHLNLGLVLRRLGRPADAVGHLRRAVELDPELAGHPHLTPSGGSVQPDPVRAASPGEGGGHRVDPVESRAPALR